VSCRQRLSPLQDAGFGVVAPGLRLRARSKSRPCATSVRPPMMSQGEAVVVIAWPAISPSLRTWIDDKLCYMRVAEPAREHPRPSPLVRDSRAGVGDGAQGDVCPPRALFRGPDPVRGCRVSGLVMELVVTPSAYRAAC
jgi:hypothetical protein